MLIRTAKQLNELAEEVRARGAEGAKTQVFVSMGTCGIAAGTTPVLEAIKDYVEEKGLDVEVVETGCMGLCHSEPSIEVVRRASGESTLYGNVAADQVEGILTSVGETAPEGCTVIPRSWFYPETEDAVDGQLQARVVLRNTGRINPENIENYIENDGYAALASVLTEKTPQDVIDCISESGLRGRGGGGFPTGRKWAFAAAQDADEKYIICNADEGDPGAFMDRAVLEGDPHAVLEAMTIAGYAVGASQGIIYIRAEYPLAIKRLQVAIAQAEERGLLGDDLFGSGFSFRLRIKYGAGAFVCGEETALIRSIAGMRGMPTFKPPFPAVEGLWKKPTIVNNVETFANIPTIIRNGADWFRKIGTDGSPGTKVFALAGKINKVGLIEVPMGMSLRTIIFELGEGISEGKAFKAVQTGGPSGGCITDAHLDTPIDYDTLKDLGSMMGSGGMIVMDEDDCMVDIAKFFLEFTMDESCGKCTPCRVGGRQMHGLLAKITSGKGSVDDLETITSLANAMKKASLCGLGTTAPNPVLATLANFEDEYLAHVRDMKCPAGKCTSLVSYSIDEDICTGCTMCSRQCPVSCIEGNPREKHVIDQDACIHCGACFDVCKFSAVLKK
jgi:NADH:ubiquinone oxidoreductase subunit F (NADH-binding)/NAD-dependent dihydropyrimidine dehydrogenase PreA subunit/(2Fe-2S) ferredoxin